MITAIEVAGFKAFSTRQRLELKPITLLFGPNSGGKSSFMHAIHYARELLKRQQVDAHFTESGGDQVELGGYEVFHHRGSDSTPDDDRGVLEIGFELDLSDTDVSAFGLEENEAVEKMMAGIESALVRWRIEPNYDYNYHNRLGYSAFQMTLHINGEEACFWRAGLEESEATPGTIVIQHKHPLYKLLAEENVEEDAPSPLALLWGDSGLDSNDFTSYEVETPHTPNAIPPNWGGPLKLGFTSGESDEEQVLLARATLTELISRLVVGIPKLILEQLEGLTYIGPMRSVPPRHHEPPKPVGLSSWADGLAAWKALETDPELLKAVGAWLGDEDRLDAKYRIEAVDTFETSTELMRALLREAEHNLNTDPSRLFDVSGDQKPYAFAGRARRQVFLRDEQGRKHHPKDVGIGYSQLVPVITAALLRSPINLGPRLIMMEQPELHIHPRLQTRLADLLIASTKDPEQPRCLLLETHSEHMILRLLRRIRETAEGGIPAGLSPLTPEELGVYHVGSTAWGTQIQQLRVDEEGEFIDRWPDGFFDERAEELFS